MVTQPAEFVNRAAHTGRLASPALCKSIGLIGELVYSVVRPHGAGRGRKEGMEAAAKPLPLTLSPL